jgi:C4-dicarboxylate transporter DctM subunit
MTLLLASFGGLLAIGVPIALVIAGAGLLYIAISTDVPVEVVAQRMFVGLDDFTLMAIPLFIFAGYLMNEIGMTQRLLVLARILIGRIFGGLAQITVLISMIFGGVTGAASADLAAVGIVMIPEMEKDGYKREFSTAMILAASLMGAVLPPSIPFIIYAVQSESSVGELFLAGVVPGIAIGLVIMVINVVLLKRQGYRTKGRGEARDQDRKSLPVALRDASIALLMPVVVIGGIVKGVFTPTEAAGIAVAYALLAGFFVYRTLTPKRLYRVLGESANMSAVVMIIVVASAVLNWCLAYSQVPQKVADGMLSLTHSPAIFLILVIILLLIVGMPLDPVPALIIMTPVLLPAAHAYGIDTVHFGVVMVLALTLGLATPPVGGSLFVAIAVGKVDMGRLSKAVVPYLCALLVLTLVVTFVPASYSWLPSLVNLGG